MREAELEILGLALDVDLAAGAFDHVGIAALDA
jgi:hypothetical protein